MITSSLLIVKEYLSNEEQILLAQAILEYQEIYYNSWCDDNKKYTKK